MAYIGSGYPKRGRPVLPVFGGPGVAALTLADKGFPALFRNGGFPVNYTESAPGVFGTDYAESSFATTGTMYYASPTGNDTTGDGSSGAPWRTPQKFADTAATGSRLTFASGRYPAVSIPASKSLSFYGPSTRDAYVGDLLTEADISAWGAPSSGRQTVTLASGTVSGFVDLTQTRRADRQGRAIPQVSVVATTAAGIATLQATTATPADVALYGAAPGSVAPVAGVFRSTPSQVGASDGRNLAGKADTDLLMWRTTAAAPMTLTATSQGFAKNVTFVGGAQIAPPSGSRLVMDNCRHLGAHDQCYSVAGTLVLKDSTARNCGLANADVIDYESGGVGVEIGVHADQCNGTGGDNCSTGHGSRVARYGGTYLDAARPVNDVQGSIIGMIECILFANTSSGARSLAGSGYDAHYAAITIIAGAGADIMIGSEAAYPTARACVYDTSLDGKSQSDPTTGAQFRIELTKRLAAKPTGDTTFVSLDLSIGNLFQDAAGTTPVSAVGQPIHRVNNIAGTGEYITFPANTYTYQMDGARPVLRQSGAANAGKGMLFLTATYLEEACNIIYGLKSSDTSGLLITLSGTNAAGDYRSSNNLTGATSNAVFIQPGWHIGVPAPTYTVDGSSTALTTATQMRAAAFNNAPHVVTIAGANLNWPGWMRTQNILLQFDGDVYGFEISRATDAANLRARQQAMATKTGATLV